MFKHYLRLLAVVLCGALTACSTLREPARPVSDNGKEAKREFRGCSTYIITSFAVFQEAPEFYLSHSRALAIISKINREKRYEGKY